MYGILTQYTVVDQMLKFVGGHVFFGGFTVATKKSANPDIRRRLGRLTPMLTLNTIAGIDRLAVKGYCTSLDYSYPRHTSASNFQVDALSKKATATVEFKMASKMSVMRLH